MGGIPKFKMADVRHIENHFLAITRLHMVRLTQLLSQAMETWQKKSEILKFKMADELYIENHFFAYNSAPTYPINTKICSSEAWHAHEG